MKTAILLLLAVAGLLRADSEYIIEGIVSDVTPAGILLTCEPSDKVGYKRAIGSTLVEGHPDAARYKPGMMLRCFGWITAKGLVNGGPPIFRFSRRR